MLKLSGNFSPFQYILTPVYHSKKFLYQIFKQESFCWTAKLSDLLTAVLQSNTTFYLEWEIEGSKLVKQSMWLFTECVSLSFLLYLSSRIFFNILKRWFYSAICCLLSLHTKNFFLSSKSRAVIASICQQKKQSTSTKKVYSFGVSDNIIKLLLKVT